MAQDTLAEALAVLAAPIGLAGHMIGHLLACRLKPSLGILRAYFVGFPCGLAVFLFYEILCLTLRPSLSLASALADLAAFLALCYTYFHFANMSYGARRVRLLRDVHGCPQGLSADELLTRYNAREMLDNRLERLIASRQIRIEDGRIYNRRPAVRGMAACLALLKRFIFGARQRSDLPQGIEALQKAAAEPRSDARP